MILRSIDSTDRGRFGGLGAYRSRWRRPARALCFLFLVLVVGCSAPAPEPTREALPEPSEVLVREGGEEQQATEVVLGEEEAVAVEVEGPPVAPPGEVGALEEPSETVGQERQAALRLRSGRPEQGTPPKRLRPSREGGLTLPVPSTVEGSKAEAGAPAAEAREPKPAAEDEGEEPGVLELTLTQAVAMALENNLQLKVELLNPLIEESQVMEALAAFDSTFYLNSTLETRQNLLIAGSAIDPFTGSVIRDEHRSDSFILAAGLRKPLSTGGVFVTQFSAQRYRYNQPGPTIQWVYPGYFTYVQSPVINPSVTTDLTFSIRQPLLRNAGRKVNQAAIELARTDERTARYTYQARALVLIGSVVRTYWGLVYQRELLAVRERSFHYARDLDAATRQAVAANILPKIEVVRTAVEVASRKADLVVARTAVADSADRLRRLLRGSAQDVADDLPIVPLDQPDQYQQSIDEKRSVYTALVNRSDFLAAKERVKANDVRLAVARNQLLPLLDLTLTWTINGLGGNLASSLGSKHHQPLNEVGLFHSSFHDFAAIISFEFPLGNRAAKSRLSQVKLTKLSHLLQLKDMEEEIIFQVREAVRAAQADAQRITTTTEARDLAAQRLRAEEDRDRMEVGRILDVLEAQDRLAQAEIEVRRALVDYHITLVTLTERQGTLLRQFLTGPAIY